ncbi:MAG: hypothetical protein ACI9U2_004072 [Bradymonadia bacterium]|jgi:hypothetical protein
MHRIIWIGGVACVAQVACIEDRTPSADLDAAATDAAVTDAAATDAAATDAAVPDDSGPPPVDPEPAPGEPEPGPEPEVELPAWICPPEGRFVFNVGACVLEAGEVPSAGRYEARITETGEGVVVDGMCGRDGSGAVLGRIGANPRWFTAVAPDGRVWQIVLDLPVDVRFEVGAQIVIEPALNEAWFSGLSGSLAISTAAGLQAFVQAGDNGAPGLNDPQLTLGRGEQSCYVEDDDEFFCTYTGYRLRASDPQVDEVRALRFGEILDVGPFQVINGGIMSIGDRGACNAPPEDFKLAAWRRR